MRPCARAPRAPRSTLGPGIDDRCRRTREVHDVARHQRQGVRLGRRGDEGVHDADRPAGGLAPLGTGGARVIYYFHDEDAPLFLLTVYRKGQKDNLNRHERNAIKQVVTGIKRQIRQARERSR